MGFHPSHWLIFFRGVGIPRCRLKLPHAQFCRVWPYTSVGSLSPTHGSLVSFNPHCFSIGWRLSDLVWLALDSQGHWLYLSPAHSCCWPSPCGSTWPFCNLQFTIHWLCAGLTVRLCRQGWAPYFTFWLIVFLDCAQFCPWLRCFTLPSHCSLTLLPWAQ